MKMTRRVILKLAAGVAATFGMGRLTAGSRQLIFKMIPASGEQIPPVGIGTNRYGAARDEKEREALQATLQQFSNLGGRLIDTAPVYGDSEAVLGDLISKLEIRDKLFLASKTDLRELVSGRESYQQSFKRLQIDNIELMQVHNLVNAQNELAAMREWQQEGRIKYIGITTSSSGQFADVERIMKKEVLDFVQLNYSLDDREAQQKLLPLAQDRGIAVLVNLPFGRGRLFSRVGNLPLPEWAAELDCESWGQFFLKYIVSHPAVTCTIPGTRTPEHVLDNFGAAMGVLPNPELRQRQERFYDDLS